MTPTPVLDEQELGLFVKSEMDDYGLDPFEFRIYARIVRRAGRKEAWESVPNMAKACMISESRVRLALQLLEAAGLIESQERSGYSTLRRLTPKSRWVHPQRLEAIRAALTRTKSATTPVKSDRGSQTHTPS
jgi:DNA-binding transcriptional ArsR family regulator